MEIFVMEIEERRMCIEELNNYSSNADREVAFSNIARKLMNDGRDSSDSLLLLKEISSKLICPFSERDIVSVINTTHEEPNRQSQDIQSSQVNRVKRAIKILKKYLDFRLDQDSHLVFSKKGKNSYLLVNSGLGKGGIHEVLYRNSLLLSDQDFKIIAGILKFEVTGQDLLNIIHRSYFDQTNEVLIIKLAEDKFVEINKYGYKEKITSNISFYYIPSGSSLPSPSSHRDIELSHILKLTNDNALTQFYAALAMTMFSSKQSPIVIFKGEAGSGKSTFAECFIGLIDPKPTSRIIMPTKPHDLAIVLSQSKVILFDNVSILQKNTQDFLCTASTGGALPKKANYTDNDNNLISVSSTVLMTSIVDPVTRSDLASRSVAIELDKPVVYFDILSDIKLNKPFLLHHLYTKLSDSIRLKGERAFTRMPEVDPYVTGMFNAIGSKISYEMFVKEEHLRRSQRRISEDKALVALLELIFKEGVAEVGYKPTDLSSLLKDNGVIIQPNKLKEKWERSKKDLLTAGVSFSANRNSSSRNHIFTVLDPEKLKQSVEGGCDE